LHEVVRLVRRFRIPVPRLHRQHGQVSAEELSFHVEPPPTHYAKAFTTTKWAGTPSFSNDVIWSMRIPNALFDSWVIISRRPSMTLSVA